MNMGCFFFFVAHTKIIVKLVNGILSLSILILGIGAIWTGYC